MTSDLDAFLRAALDEDVGSGDLTTAALIDPAQRARGVLRLRDAGVVAGIDAALRVFRLLEPEVEIVLRAAAGDAVAPAGVAGEVVGAARTLLTGERLALNLLARLSGIATLTRQYVDAVAGTGVSICDTRKTTPLLRRFEKDAVRAGGGVNHRFGLYDAVLVKDNHLDLLRASGSQVGMADATRQARAKAPPGTFIQVEAQDLEEALAVADAGADSVLFDNFRPPALRDAVRQVRARAGSRPIVLEASGGISLSTVRAFAETGVDRISIGALTHGARSLDVTMEINPI